MRAGLGNRLHRPRRKERERDLERELRSHLELETEERAGSGLSAEEARSAAQRAFGNTAMVKEEVREMWGWSSMERFWQDLNYAARTMRRNPGFAITAVLSLALGVGANAAIFALIDAALMKPLAGVREPDKLVRLSHPSFS